MCRALLDPFDWLQGSVSSLRLQLHVRIAQGLLDRQPAGQWRRAMPRAVYANVASARQLLPQLCLLCWAVYGRSDAGC